MLDGSGFECGICGYCFVPASEHWEPDEEFIKENPCPTCGNKSLISRTPEELLELEKTDLRID